MSDMVNNNKIKIYKIITNNVYEALEHIIENVSDDVDIIYVIAKSNKFCEVYKFNLISDEYEDINVEDIIYLAFIKGYDRES